MNSIRHVRNLFTFTFALIFLLALIGCAATPNKVERFLFDISTNYTPHVIVATNTVTVTNYVPIEVWQTHVVTVTNEVGATAFQTNVTHLTNTVTRLVNETNVLLVTNLIPQLDFTPKEAVTVAAKVGGTAVGDMFGVGGLLGTALASAFAIYGRFRSRKVNEGLTQSIATAREILKTTPQGQELDENYKNWLIKNQKANNILQTVRDLVDNYVDNDAAREAADLIARRAAEETNRPA